MGYIYLPPLYRHSPGDGLHVVGMFSQTTPPPREKIPPVEDPGYNGSSNLRSSYRGLVLGVCDCGPTGWWFEYALCRSTLTFPPVVHDWVNKGLGISSRVCATGHIKDPVPLIEKSRVLCTSGRFPPSFIPQAIITRLNKLYDCMFSP